MSFSQSLLHRAFHMWRPTWGSKSRRVEHGERFLQKEMEKTSGPRSGIYILDNKDPSGAKKWVTHITKRMATMSLKEEKQRKRRRTAPAQPYPTGAQIKNLTRKAEDALKATGTPLTPDKLFLGMLAVLSCTLAVSANYTYWTYIPAPPLLQFADWSEPSPLVFTNDSQHFPPPWSRAGPTHPDEEGKAVNISIGYNVLPICFGASPPCMSIFPQWWGYSYNNGTGLRMGFFVATSFLLNQSERYYHGQISNSTDALFLPGEPPCETVSWRKKHQGPSLLWSECRGIFGKISRYLNFTFVDWGPHGMFVNCSEWEVETCNGTKNIRFNHSLSGLWHQQNDILNWYNGGLSPPRPRMIHPQLGPEHWHIWKIPASLHQFATLVGHARTSGPQNYTITYSGTGFIQACVRPPFLFAIGEFIITKSTQLVHCTNCKLYTCLNHSLPFNHSREGIFLMKQRAELWIPISLDEPWSDARFLSFLLKRVVKRTKRFIDWVILGIVSLITVVSLGTVSGMALHNSIQNHEFITSWHHDSHELWTQQAKIDQQIQARLDEIEDALIYVGDQINQLKLQLKLKCHWKSTDFCITNLPYNASEYPWDSVKAHLQLQKTNMSLDIEKLKKQIYDSYSHSPPELYSSKFYDALTSALSSLDPRSWFPSAHIVSYVLIILIICIGVMVLRPSR